MAPHDQTSKTGRMIKRAKQAAFVALNLRLPPDLHKRLRESAGTTRSLNAEILDRLQKSFDTVTQKEGWREKFIARTNRRAEEQFRHLAERIDQLEARLGEARHKRHGMTVGTNRKDSKKD